MLDPGEANEISRREDSSLPLRRPGVNAGRDALLNAVGRVSGLFNILAPGLGMVDLSFEYRAETGAFHMDVESITEID